MLMMGIREKVRDDVRVKAMLGDMMLTKVDMQSTTFGCA